MSLAEKAYYCSGCGKRHDEVANLIALAAGFICNECVAVLHDIEQKRVGAKGGRTALLPEGVREIVAKEVRRAFREHESEFATIVSTTVTQALAETLGK